MAPGAHTARVVGVVETGGAVVPASEVAGGGGVSVDVTLGVGTGAVVSAGVGCAPSGTISHVAAGSPIKRIVPATFCTVYEPAGCTSR